MAKDRFSKHKPINWHSGFKQTGSFIKPEKTNTKYRTKNQQDFIDAVSICWNNKMNSWELEFIANIRFTPWLISDKQWNKLKEINDKYNLKYPDFANSHLNKKTS